MAINVKQGDRIVMTGVMDDPDPIPVGTEGTVTHVNELPGIGLHEPDWAQIHVDWDNGRTLIVLDTDSFAVVTDQGGKS